MEQTEMKFAVVEEKKERRRVYVPTYTERTSATRTPVTRRRTYRFGACSECGSTPCECEK